MPDPAAVLADRLRDLMRYAAQGGAAAAWLDLTADALIAALCELDDFRAGARDPRRMQTLVKAERVAHAKACGASIQQLAERFACGRQHVHKLLRLHAESVARHEATVSRSNGHGT